MNLATPNCTHILKNVYNFFWSEKEAKISFFRKRNKSLFDRFPKGCQ